MHLDSFEEVKRLTKEMVAIPSINKVPYGETAAAKYVYDYYANLEYFKRNPDYIKMFKTIDDSPERHSTYAFIKGTKGKSNKTVIMIGHVDTVGVDDYGILKDFAFDADALPSKFLEMNISDVVNEDIQSGDFMFGRGALDMKSGVAGHMVIMKYFAEHPEELNGNLLAIAECDEEDMSKGIISALDEIVNLKSKEGFDYVACINADYSTNYNPGDENRYIYYGCIGKTLPTFVAFGKEAHVGQSFAALDPNLLIAEITRRMSLNTDLCDIAYGEVTVPPISLKQTDTKVGYTVQTALVAMGYYNFFTHAMNPGQVLDKSKKVAEAAFDDIIEYLNVQYKKFCELSKVSFTPLPWKKRVYTWKEFYEYLAATAGEEFVNHMDRFGKELHESDPGMDLRQYGFTMCQEAWKWSKDKSPAIVVFFGSLYSANIEMTGKTEKEKALMQAVETAVGIVAPEAGRQIKTRMFYPYIADSSFMAVGGDPSTVDILNDNMPSTKYKYKHDIEKIMQIDVPVVNIGTFGRDGHMITERVDMKQTFENVPNISYETIKALLG
ncbi:MAG: M20/M25/M40 family metallo-hydrolase [Clostridia bacterium]|nr:M20/M25/M40 family metallo-hydrolase [Clostridia bacterium]